MKVEPYLHFEGCCEEAIEFYRKALGAELLMLMRYNENPDLQTPGMVPPGLENKVMHASLQIGQTRLMLSDGRYGGDSKFQGVTLSLSVQSDDEAKLRFAALSDGGQVQMPLAKTFFCSSFGMLADRFGVSWMILVAP